MSSTTRWSSRTTRGSTARRGASNRRSDNGLSVWASSGSLAGVSLGALQTVAQYHSICYYVQHSGAVGRNNVSAKFRVAGESAERTALPPVAQTMNDGNNEIIGKIIKLTPNTTYEILVTVTNAIGETAWVYGSVTTRADSIPAASSLTTTKYVNAATGNDTTGTGASGAPWKSLAKVAATYATNDVIELAAGYYVSNSEQMNRGAMTIKGANPPVSDPRSLATINDGNHAIIEPPAVSAPTGTVTSDAWVTVAPWQQVQVQGPGRGGNTLGAWYGGDGVTTDGTLWKWESCPVSNAITGGYAATRSAAPSRLANWKVDADLLSTPGGFGETLKTNRQYRFGFWSSGTTIYARLPGDLDPNTLWLKFSAANQMGIYLQSSGCRVTGIVTHCMDRGVYCPSANQIVDHCWTAVSFRGIQMAAVANLTAEYNRVEDTNMWGDQSGGQDTSLIAWDFVKNPLILANGTTYGSKIGGNAEVPGIHLTSGASRGVVRYNLIQGTFDGVGVVGWSSTTDPHGTRTWGESTDVYENTIRRMADDALEPENLLRGFAAWGNTIQQTLSALSMGPLHLGPAIYALNQVWRVGNAGVGRRVDGTIVPQGRNFKFSSKSSPRARCYVVHNTIWTDQTSPNTIDLAGDSAGGAVNGVEVREEYWFKNNIVRVTRYLLDEADAGSIVEDFDALATTDPLRGMVYNNTDYDNTSASTRIANYRTVTGQAGNTNKVSGVSYEFNDPAWVVIVDGALTDPTNGDLTLKVGAVLRLLGTPVPNISDRIGTDYLGVAPNLGYQP